MKKKRGPYKTNPHPTPSRNIRVTAEFKEPFASLMKGREDPEAAATGFLDWYFRASPRDLKELEDLHTIMEGLLNGKKPKRRRRDDDSAQAA